MKQIRHICPASQIISASTIYTPNLFDEFSPTHIEQCNNENFGERVRQIVFISHENEHFYAHHFKQTISLLNLATTPQSNGAIDIFVAVA